MDATDRLVSQKSLSHKNVSLDWRPGPIKVGQKFKNMSFCDVIKRKLHTQIK